MSLIWDLLSDHGRCKGREEDAKNALPESIWKTEPRITADRRKSARESVYVPLFVYGYDSAAQPFHQDTHTLQVSAGGGLLRLDAKVKHGQKLLLMNRVTKQEQECQVVALKNHLKRSHVHVGVSFTRPAPEFWKARR